MIGSDVVDLRDAESRPESFRPRFDERVFTPEERRAIEHDADPLACRWAHWGAKEAAYKLVKQLDSEFIFSPGRWRVEFESRAKGPDRERRGRLEIPTSGERPARSIELRSFETSDRVHVLAIPMGSDWSAVTSRVERLVPPRIDASLAVRELAAHEIARRLGVARSRVTIAKRNRIPLVLLDGSPADLSLSLSHHGAWIGFATAPSVDPLGELISSTDSNDADLRSARAEWSR